MVSSFQQSSSESPKACPDRTCRIIFSPKWRCCRSSRRTQSRGAEAAKRLGPVLMQTYGTSECRMLTALQPSEHARPELLASVGRAAPGVELSIPDGDGREAPTDGVGKVCARSAQQVRERLDNEDRAVVPRDGWLRTGAVGRLDRDGYLYLLDRVEDQPAPGLYSHPIEHMLTEHPAVVQAAVFMVPHAGEQVLAAVVVGRKGRELDPQALRALVRGRLGQRFEPRHLWTIDELPRTPGGKPDKLALRSYGGDQPMAGLKAE
ncbi:AMP-binding protein [Nonomuraea angiospora]|uniref:AMP-binding enzyme n=1 Tax=Nonomuraea angiospora TaxID=46172 RepID=UPI00333044AB